MELDEEKQLVEVCEGVMSDQRDKLKVGFSPRDPLRN
jgi:hypothetical protein